MCNEITKIYTILTHTDTNYYNIIVFLYLIMVVIIMVIIIFRRISFIIKKSLSKIVKDDL